MSDNFNRDDGVLYYKKLRRQARPPKDIFAPKVYEAKIELALGQVNCLEHEINELKEYFTETVAQTIKRFIERKKWKSSIFQAKTGLDQSWYRKIKTIHDVHIGLPAIISICVGLGLPQQISQQLITRAGYSLKEDCIEHIVYAKVISGVLPNDIPAINAVIDEIAAKHPGEKIRRLGSSPRDWKQ